MASFLLSSLTLSSPSALHPRTKLGESARKAGTLCGPNLGRSRRTLTNGVKCSAAAPYEGNVPKFPRRNVWDPYRRLGISPYSSEEEIWSSRNFLLEQYAGDESSEESIEAAFEKLLMTSFKERKKSKINLKSQLKKKVQESPPWFLNFLNLVEMPHKDIIFRRLFLFASMGAWSITSCAEGGPAFQCSVVSLVAVSCVLGEKTKNWGRATSVGMGTLVTGVVVGSILGPLVPISILPRTWNLELLTSLVACFFLFLGCTFLK